MMADELREKLDELFDKWKHNQHFEEEYKEHFHEDGPFKYDIYCKQDVKILFLLKETNGGKFDSFTDFYDTYFDKDSKKYNPCGSNLTMWRRVREWTEGLLTDKDYEDILAQNIATEYGTDDPLRKVAVINVKKHGGGASSISKELQKYAEDKREKEYFIDEIRLLEPDIIVCGNTWWLLEILTKGNNSVTLKRLNNADKNDVGLLTIDERDIKVIDMYHPAASGKNKSKKELYKMLIDKYKKFKTD